MKAVFLLLVFAAAGTAGSAVPKPVEEAAVAPAAAHPAGPAEIVADMPLGDALAAIQENGLPLVWSSLLVGPELRVTAAPIATDPIALLEELLAPHGLALERRGATLLVVQRSAVSAAATLTGTVRSRRAAVTLAGVEIRLLESDRRTRSGADGRFELTGIEPGSYRVEVRRPGYVIDEPRSVTLAAGESLELALALEPAPFSGEEIVVQPSRISLLVDEPAPPLALTRDEIAALPHLVGDVFRALDLLPGVVANDISAEIQVRGGRRDETLVLLDGQEIYDAYHLKDFDNALSLVPAATVDLLHLSTGALPVSRGDRMGAALELTSFTPSEPGRFRLSVSLLDVQLELSDRSRDRLSWLASARYGNGALVGALFGEEDPRFWDLFAKADLSIDETQSLRATVLGSADRLDFREQLDGEARRFDTEYANRYLWVTHQKLISDRLYVDSAASVVGFDRDRRGFEDEEEKTFTVRDERDIEVFGGQQAWGLQPPVGGTWSAGFEARRYLARYDYASHRRFDSPFAGLRSEPRDGDFTYVDEISDDSLGAWLSNRARPSEKLTLELGVRYDRHTAAQDTVWSPRAALAWAVGPSSVVRLAGGRHAQSQRAYELMVTDGDTRFYPAERATHAALGFEHRFSRRPNRLVSGVRFELYHHEISTPRPRYESLFEPFEPFVEGELDRARIEPDESRSQGAELFLHGQPHGRFAWWANYTYARAEDRLRGLWIPRQIDQRHTFNLDVTLPLGEAWALNLAWRFHTGRPTTPVGLVLETLPHPPDPEGPEGPGEPEDDESALAVADHEVVPRPVLGRINSSRLPDYHRLDLRLSRDWPLERGKLTFFADVQNLYNRANVAGYDVELDEEVPEIVRTPERWPGFLASAGISWQF